MALFTEKTEDFQRYVPVVKQFSLKTLLPYLDAAADDVLPRFLGQTVTDQLLALPGGGDPADPSPVLDKALELTRRAIAGICVADNLTLLEVMIGGDGITISAADNRKAAFEYQTKKVEARLANGGWAALDKLIGLVADNPDEFPGWVDAPYYAEHQGSLFKSAAEFSRYYGIQDRWLTFWALRPWIRPVEELAVARQARIDALTAATLEQRALLQRKLLRAAAYQAVIDALPNLSIELNGSNIQVNYAGQYGNTGYFQAPGRDHLDWVMLKLQRQADAAWESLDVGIADLTAPDLSTVTDTSPGWLNDDDSTLIAL